MKYVKDAYFYEGRRDRGDYSRSVTDEPPIISGQVILE
jgi:hypothetical protein